MIFNISCGIQLMKTYIVLLFAIPLLIMLSGCCGLTNPQSSSCPYGTYGESCSLVCKNTGGGSTCFTQCMDSVRAAGLGDATTCCKETYGMYCERSCRNIGQSYGEDAYTECVDGCKEIIKSANLPEDICYIPGL